MKTVRKGTKKGVHAEKHGKSAQGNPKEERRMWIDE